MTTYPSWVQTGTVGNPPVPVMADISQLGASAVSVYVTLNQPYTLQCSPGQPTRPQFCGAEVRLGRDVPGTVIAAGARILLLAFEASALVAMNVATYS